MNHGQGPLDRSHLMRHPCGLLLGFLWAQAVMGAPTCGHNVLPLVKAFDDKGSETLAQMAQRDGG